MIVDYWEPLNRFAGIVGAFYMCTATLRCIAIDGRAFVEKYVDRK